MAQYIELRGAFWSMVPLELGEIEKLKIWPWEVDGWFRKCARELSSVSVTSSSTNESHTDFGEGVRLLYMPVMLLLTW